MVGLGWQPVLPLVIDRRGRGRQGRLGRLRPTRRRRRRGHGRWRDDQRGTPVSLDAGRRSGGGGSHSEPTRGEADARARDRPVGSVVQGVDKERVGCGRPQLLGRHEEREPALFDAVDLAGDGALGSDQRQGRPRKARDGHRLREPDTHQRLDRHVDRVVGRLRGCEGRRLQHGQRLDLSARVGDGVDPLKRAKPRVVQLVRSDRCPRRTCPARDPVLAGRQQAGPVIGTRQRERCRHRVDAAGPRVPALGGGEHGPRGIPAASDENVTGGEHGRRVAAARRQACHVHGRDRALEGIQHLDVGDRVAVATEAADDRDTAVWKDRCRMRPARVCECHWQRLDQRPVTELQGGDQSCGRPPARQQPAAVRDLRDALPRERRAWRLGVGGYRPYRRRRVGAHDRRRYRHGSRETADQQGEPRRDDEACRRVSGCFRSSHCAHTAVLLLIDRREAARHRHDRHQGHGVRARRRIGDRQYGGPEACQAVGQD